MATGRSVIVGGGIQAGSPFTLGSLTRIVNTNPATIADSIVFQRTKTATEVITVGTDVQAATVTEILQVSGGFISDTGAHDNFIAGRGATANPVANARNVVIGTLARVTAGVGGTENVLIGYNTLLRTTVGSSVIVGAANQQGNNFPVPTTIVGASNLFDFAFSGPGVGTGSSWMGANVGIGNQQTFSAVNNGVGIGRAVRLDDNSLTVIGDAARGDAGHVGSIVMGRNARSIAANSLVAGGTGVPIAIVLIGAGDTQAGGQAVIHRYTDAVGADNPGADVTFRASRGTGAATTGARFRFQTGTIAASSSTLQAVGTRFEVVPSFGVTGTPAQSAGVNFENVLDGAGATALVWTNLPSANQPFWLPVLVNGAIAYLPALRP